VDLKFDRCRFVPFGWRQLKDPDRGKDYAAGHVVLRFPDVSGSLVRIRDCMVSSGKVSMILSMEAALFE
jgi:hypothetical protein